MRKCSLKVTSTKRIIMQIISISTMALSTNIMWIMKSKSEIFCFLACTKGQEEMVHIKHDSSLWENSLSRLYPVFFTELGFQLAIEILWTKGLGVLLNNENSL